MEIYTSLFVPTDPETLFGFMLNPDFLAEVARESGAIDHAIRVQGLTTTSQRTLRAPEKAHKITGPTIQIIEERAWSTAQPDGSRSATVSLTAPGQPITMPGYVTISPSGGQSRIDVRGELSVKIPLVGKKVEKMAAPAVEDGIRAEERVARRWLQH